MSWNYRLLKFKTDPVNPDSGWTYGIVEAFYNEAGLLTHHSERAFITAESEAGIIEELGTIRRAIAESTILIQDEFEFADPLSDEE
jgi:hypothetical protein